ncbi:hypothetical protein [Enterococcus faecalis]|uniref:hypothetical protein n=1 Tax=Enterococcus faecalis TaxID=1351 RepID=UPI00132FC1C4|nr:hypothetical protein [Enterococcus faecalis]
MTFKNQGQMLNYVKEKEKQILKEIDRSAEREGILDNKKLPEYKYLMTSILDVEVAHDSNRSVEDKKFPTPQKVDKYLETTFRDQMDSAWKEMFGK